MSAWKIIILLRTQFFLVAFLLGMFILSSLKVIPSTSEVVSSLQEFFELHGLLAVSVVSFAENIVGMNSYFPGSVVILISMAMTAGDIEKALMTFLAIYLPAILAHNINFFLGRLSSSKKKIELPMKDGFPKKRSLAFIYLVTFWHPHLTALSCLASGSEGVPYKKFMYLFVVVSLFWNSAWGVAMYNIGSLYKQDIDFMFIMVAYIILWAIYDGFRYWKLDAKTAPKKSI